MRVVVLHLFCNGVLSETRVFDQQAKARAALVQALDEVGAGLLDGEVVDVNGAIWSGVTEGVEVE